LRRDCLLRRGVYATFRVVYKYAQGVTVEFEWDPNKAASNLRKHGVRFAEAATVFEDDAILTMPEDNLDEERFVAVGLGSLGHVLVVVYTTRDDAIRIISARRATRKERADYEGRSK
jgi:uncharacterized protein